MCLSSPVSYTHLDVYKRQLQVIVVEYEMHVIFISPVAGEQATVEEGCGLILVKPPAIQVIYVESKPQSFVCIDGKIGFEAFFSVTAASSFVIAQVREWRKCIGEYDIFRTLYAKVVWVGEKVLAGSSKIMYWPSSESACITRW